MEKLLKQLHSGIISQRQFINKCRNDKNYIDYIENKTSFLDIYNLNILERLYYIINDLHEIVKCKYCGNKAKWSGRLTTGYKIICDCKECKAKHLSASHVNKTSITNNRNNKFIHEQSVISFIDDSVIINLIKYDKFVNLIDNQIIIDYLNNRFNDSNSLLESVQRIRFGIEEKPKCPTCNKPVVWIGKPSKLYTKYCCNKCRAKNSETHKKLKETQLKNWGSKSCYASNKYKQYILNKYGVEYHLQREDIKEKRKDKLIEHFGTTNLYEVDEIRNKIINTNIQKFGYPSIFESPEIRQKIYETCKKNGKLSSSKQEDKIYDWLLELGYNVERFVRSAEFPFNVDFYLKNYNLYIEYQGSQFHNGRPYLGTPKDLQDLEVLKKKNEERIKITGKKTSQYQSIINTWSIYDVKKRNYAKEHNINLLEIYKCKSKQDLQYQITIYLTKLNNKQITIN